MTEYTLPKPTRNLIDFILGVPVHENNWSDMIDCALQHNMLPQFCVRALQSPAGIPETIVEWCSQQRQILIVQAVARSFVIASITRLMHSSGITPVWLKGAALAHSVYPSVWMRSMVDLDVLVPFEQREEAYTVIHDAGYKPYHIPLQHLSHHYVFLGNELSDVVVELHYHLTPQGTLPLSNEAAQWFNSQTTLLETPSVSFSILRPEAMLLHIAAHDILQHDLSDLGASTYLEGIKLQRKYDLHLLISKHELDWQTVIGKARELQWDMALHLALEQIRFLFDSPVPEEVIAVLQPKAERAEFYSLELRKQLNYLRVFAVLPWSDKLRYAFHSLFLSKESMRRKYDLTPQDRVWPLYIKRLWSIARQFPKLLKAFRF
jgi:hypothetical protein